MGTATSALAFSGSGPGTKYAQTETWNGSAWTEVGDLNTARSNTGGAGVDSTSALAYGGYTTTYLAITESWNGSAWTETVDISTPRASGGSSGIATSALYSGGQNPSGKITTTEEFTSPVETTVTFTAS